MKQPKPSGPAENVWVVYKSDDGRRYRIANAFLNKDYGDFTTKAGAEHFAKIFNKRDADLRHVTK